MGAELVSRIAEYRDRLAAAFKKSACAGPPPYKVALHIVNMMAGEYSDNANFLNAYAGLVTELVEAGRNQIRCNSWTECSKILSRARSLVDGITPQVDACMVGEYVAIFRSMENSND